MYRLLVLVAIVACSPSSPSSKGDPAPIEQAPQPKPKHEDRHDPKAVPGELALDIFIAGAKTQWGEAEFAAVPKIDGAASDGEARDTWSLRELVHHHVGPTARAITVIGADGRKAIAPADWDDAKRTPILHTTRRGSLKFRWADTAGKWGETEMKDVSGIEITK